MKGGGGFLLLVVGALGLIGFLTGNLDRWLGYLFTPGGSGTGDLSAAVTGPMGGILQGAGKAAAGAGTSAVPNSADRRPGAPAIAGGLSA